MRVANLALSQDRPKLSRGMWGRLYGIDVRYMISSFKLL